MATYKEHMSRTTKDTSETVKGGLDKLARYGWTVIDAPGEFMMIPKWKLHVDADYQRDATGAKVLEIASAWSWIANGAISVGRRDGKWWVFDGQHRVLAAMKRSDIKELPCMVFKTKDQAQEARAFLVTNTLRRPVTAIEKFKAKVAAGDEVAVYVKGVLDERGVMVGKESEHPGMIRCIDLAQRIAAADRETFIEVIDFVIKLCAKAMGISERMLAGTYYLHKHCGAGLQDRRLVERLILSGPGRLLEGAGRAAAYYAKGGAKVYAQGFLDVVNKGLRERFELDPAD